MLLTSSAYIKGICLPRHPGRSSLLSSSTQHPTHPLSQPTQHISLNTSKVNNLPPQTDQLSRWPTTKPRPPWASAAPSPSTSGFSNPALSRNAVLSPSISVSSNHASFRSVVPSRSTSVSSSPVSSRLPTRRPSKCLNSQLPA